MKKKKILDEHVKSVDLRQGVTIVRLYGSINYKNLMSVREEFLRKIKNLPAKNIVFDLKHVVDADTAGLAMIVNLFKHMKESGRGEQIGLINLSQKMRDLLEISKLNKVFKEYLSERRAITSLLKS